MRPQVLLAALLVAAETASAALVVRPGPTALGASAVAGASAASYAAQVPQWTAAFDSFLSAPSPDAASVRAPRRRPARRPRLGAAGAGPAEGRRAADRPAGPREVDP